MTEFKCEIGDRVAYSAQWLRNVGLQTGDMPQLRGTVVELKDLGSRVIATVDWDLNGAPYTVMRVLVVNLAHVGANMRFCQC